MLRKKELTLQDCLSQSCRLLSPQSSTADLHKFLIRDSLKLHDELPVISAVGP